MKTYQVIALSALLLSALPSFGAATMDPNTSDSKIVEAAKNSYNYKTVLENRVSITSKNGVVTLTGTVPDSDQKALAEDTVANLPGVVRVDNQIKVESPGAEHSDTWIALKIRWQLLAHANVSATSTTVKVDNGVVTLTGNADNQAQKDLTEAYAKEVDGVKSVKNDMIIKPPAGSTPEEAMDDASITTQIQYLLREYSSTRTLKPKIVTTNGNVVIVGQASSDEQKALVTKLAKSARGVKSVTNDMTVTK